MKKIFILLATLALLSLTACISKDATEKLQQTPAQEVIEQWAEVTTIPVSLSTGGTIENVLSDWTNASKYTALDNVYKVEGGAAWGTKLAFMALTDLGINNVKDTYTSITFKIKSDNLEKFQVAIPTSKTKEVLIQDGMDLGNGWYEWTFDFSDSAYDGTDENANQIAIYGGWLVDTNITPNFYIKDITLTEKID